MKIEFTIKNTLIIEFVSLFILIGSLFWLGKMTQAGHIISAKDVIIPIIASALTLGAFAANMYLRWIKVGEGIASKIHKLIFAVFAAALLFLWAIGVLRTLSSLS